MSLIIFPYDEGMFDSSTEIDSFIMDKNIKDAVSVKDFISEARFFNTFMENLNESYSLYASDAPKSKIRSLYESGNFEEAVRCISENYVESFIKSLAFAKLGLWQEAIAELDKTSRLKVVEVDSICSIVRAACYFGLKEYDSAFLSVKDYNDDYSSLIKALIYKSKHLDDSLIKTLLSVESERIEPERSYLLLNAYYRKKDYSNTIAMIERFEIKFPYFTEIIELKYIKGQILYKRGYFKRSIMAMQDVILGSDSNSTIVGNAYYIIGKNYFMLGDYDKMEEYLYFVKLDASRSDFKKNAEFLDGKGFFLKKDYRKAAEKLTLFIEKYPEDELTQYALQLLSQAHFYLKNYKKSSEFMDRLKSASFFADKLVMMKYFIDYKNKIYPDSISAYLSFLSKEIQNPMRREAYELIIKESSSDSLKIWSFENLNREFPESENLYVYAVSLCPLIIDKCSSEHIMKLLDNLRKYREEKFEEVMLLYLRELYGNHCYSFIVEIYSKYSRDIKNGKKEASYLTALSLNEMKNTDGALFMLEALSTGEGEYADSSALMRARIYYEIHDASFLKDYIEQIKETKNPFVEGELYRIYGRKLFVQKRYSEARDAFLMSAELFKDNRNMAALALLECSDASRELGELNESVIFAEKALLLATDIEIQNKIKLHMENLK
ncbi:MAG: tol-pal system YbgF family protein [bacterium]